MGSPSAAQLIALWDGSPAVSAHRRLEPLLAAMEPGAALGRDTLGVRNRRLLALHRSLSDAPLDARLRCAACGTDNEFAVPAASILDCRAPDPAARAVVRSGRRRLTFRLPLMADIEAAPGPAAEDALAHIVARCRIGGKPGERVCAPVLARLAARFESLDPAARIVVALRCAECRGALRATIDIAEFVAADVERIVDRLLREIDVIARAYGWTEHDILALPAARRRRYVAMIARDGPARPELARRA